MADQFVTKEMVEAALPRMGLPQDQLECVQSALNEAFKANKNLSASQFNAVVETAQSVRFDSEALSNMTRVTAKDIVDNAVPPSPAPARNPVAGEPARLTRAQAVDEIAKSKMSPDFQKEAVKAVEQLPESFTPGEARKAIEDRLASRFSVEAIQNEPVQGLLKGSNPANSTAGKAAVKAVEEVAGEAALRGLLKQVAKRIPLVGGIVTAGFVAEEAVANAMEGNWQKAGGALAVGIPEAAINFTGAGMFGAGDGARELIREGIKESFGPDATPEKSGLRSMAEAGYGYISEYTGTKKLEQLDPLKPVFTAAASGTAAPGINPELGPQFETTIKSSALKPA